MSLLEVYVSVIRDNLMASQWAAATFDKVGRVLSLSHCSGLIHDKQLPAILKSNPSVKIVFAESFTSAAVGNVPLCYNSDF